MKRRQDPSMIIEILNIVLASFVFSHQIISSASHHHVQFLPGFQGPLPFHLQTGYVGVGDSAEEGGQVFYYFIESEKDPENDPLMLWLSGGPGCSSFSGLAFEIGPIAFKLEENNGSLPNLVLRPQAWTKACSIIFVDLPLGSGFSYANTYHFQRSDWSLINHAHHFLRKWLIDNPRFQNNQVYIGGDSYSGIPIPAIVQEISNGNEERIQPWINLQGYVLGNPVTTLKEENYLPSFAHGMALISDELYMSLQKNCKGNFVNIDLQNRPCLRDYNTLRKLLSGLDPYNILDPKCVLALSRRLGLLSRRSLNTRPPLNCQSYLYLLSYDWLGDDKVQEALHIRKGTTKSWQRCNPFDYDYNIISAFPYHVNLSQKGYRSLIYSGDHDPKVTFISTQAWIRDLNYSIVEDWRPWLSNGQVAGYTRRYSNQMTFATVKGAGHVAPEYKSEECFNMFIRWISNKPL